MFRNHAWRARLAFVMLAILILMGACSSPAAEPTRAADAQVLRPTAPAASTPVATVTAQPLGTLVPTVQRTQTALPIQSPTTPAVERSSVYVAPTPDCLAGSGAPRLPGLRGGVNLPPALSAAQLGQSLDLVRGLGLGWVRMTLPWRELEPQPGQYRWESLDVLIEAAQSRELRLLLAIKQAPEWAATSGGLPEDPAVLGRFLAALANHAGAAVAAYEIWPAPNTAAANGGTTTTAAAYVEALKAAYSAIKASNPCALVLTGALEPSASRDPQVALDDLFFYRQMLSYNRGEVRDYYDILALKLNTSGAFGKGKWPRASPAQSRGFFGHMDRVRDEMLVADEAEKQIWIVQTGYQVAGEFAVTPEQQAEFWRELLTITHEDYAWTSALFVHTINLGVVEPDGADYSLTEADGSPRPAYAAVAEGFGRLRARRDQAVSIQGSELLQLWEFGRYGRISAQLLGGPDGTIYAATTVGFVRAVDPNGAYHSLTRMSKQPVIGVVVDAQRRIYASTADGGLLAVQDGGNYLWNVALDGAGSTPLLLSADQQLLFTGTTRERIAAYHTADGSLRWQFQLDGISGAPAFSPDGSILVSSSEGSLFAIGADGSLRWKASLGDWAQLAPQPVEQLVFVATRNGTLQLLQNDGSLVWRVELGAAPTGIVLDTGGQPLLSLSDGRLLAFDRNGTLRWGTQVTTAALSGLVQLSDGRIVVSGQNGIVQLFGPDGLLLGGINLETPLSLPPLLGRDGAFYLWLPEHETLLAFGPPELRRRLIVP